MRVPFRKMHGAGNDFVVLDERVATLGLTPARIAALAHRRTGIGCDQLITIGPAEGADARLRFFNPDGGEAGACGNGTRCVAAMLMEQAGGPVHLRTQDRVLRAERRDGQVSVDMGPPSFEWRDIPLAVATDTLHLPLPGQPAAAAMGNPHITFFTADVDEAERRGPEFVRHALFPQGVNAGFATVLAPDRLRLRVWERGAGLTLACGSGACAAAVNAHRRGLTGRRVSVVVDGGLLDITWREDNHVEMAGPVVTSFQGSFDLAAEPLEHR